MNWQKPYLEKDRDLFTSCGYSFLLLRWFSFH